MVRVPTPPSGVLVIRNVQACCSCETLAEVITEPGACRVLARSAFGHGHDPDGGVALRFVVVADCVRVTAGLFDVQATASKVTRTASTLRLILMGVRPIRREAGMTPLPLTTKI